MPSRDEDDLVRDVEARVKEGIIEDLIEPLSGALSRELRRLCQQVQKDIRGELRRLVDEQETALSLHAVAVSPPAVRVAQAPQPPGRPETAPLQPAPAARAHPELPGVIADAFGDAPDPPDVELQRMLAGVSMLPHAAGPGTAPAPPEEKPPVLNDKVATPPTAPVSTVARLDGSATGAKAKDAPAPKKTVNHCHVVALAAARQEGSRIEPKKSVRGGSTCTVRTVYEEDDREEEPSQRPSQAYTIQAKGMRERRRQRKIHNKMNFFLSPERRTSKGDVAQMLNKLRSSSEEADIEISQTELWLAALEDFVESDPFDYIMGFFLLANAAVIGIQVDYGARHQELNSPAYFLVLEIGFTIFFCAELLFRITAVRFKLKHFFLHALDARWNSFDATVVGFSLLDLCSQPFAVEEDMIGNLSIIRLFRLARIVRLVRLVRLIPELKSMVYLIRASMGSFLWTMVLMFMMVYGFAVYFTEMAADIVRKGDLEVHKIRSHWGDMNRSMLTLFMAMTGGDDWRNFLEVFAEDQTLYWVVAMLFVLYVAFMMLVMLNLVTGVFVDGAARIIQEDKENELMRSAAKAFNKADINADATLTTTELHDLIESGALDEYCASLCITPGEAEQFFVFMAENGSGTVDCVEFMKATLKLRGNARAADLLTLQYSMKAFEAKITVMVRDGFEEVKKLYEAARSTGDLIANGLEMRMASCMIEDCV